MHQDHLSSRESYMLDAGTDRLLAAIRNTPDVEVTPHGTQRPKYELVISPRLHRGITRQLDHPDVALSLQRQGVHHGKRPRGGP